jgi:hypothetical protein
VRLDDPPADRQPRAGAFRLGVKKRLKKALRVICRNSAGFTVNMAVTAAMKSSVMDGTAARGSKLLVTS